MNYKKRNIISLLINGFIAITSFVIMINGITNGASQGQVGEDMIGIGYFKPYTIDTNVLNGLVALIMAIYNIYNLINNKDILPRFMVVLQLISTVGVTVTILTVVFFLAPMFYISNQNFMWLFMNDMFFFHFLNPILSIINFIVLDRRYKLNIKEVALGMCTTIIYSFVYMYNVVITKNWTDFYNFTFNGNPYMSVVSVVVMYLVTFVISHTLTKLNRKTIFVFNQT